MYRRDRELTPHYSIGLTPSQEIREWAAAFLADAEEGRTLHFNPEALSRIVGHFWKIAARVAAMEFVLGVHRRKFTAANDNRRRVI